MTTIRPLDGNVLVERDKVVDRTAGGIVLPDQAKSKEQRGTVRAVGPGRMLECGQRCPMQIRVGDRVMFASYTGTETELGGPGGQVILMMTEQDILGVLEG